LVSPKGHAVDKSRTNPRRSFAAGGGLGVLRPHPHAGDQRFTCRDQRLAAARGGHHGWQWSLGANPRLTLYCFSNENWKRPAEELSFLMSLLKQYLIRERATLVERQVRLKIIGRREGLPADVLQEMDQSVALSQHHTGLTLCLAINYGARQELVDAVRRIGEEVRVGSLPVEEIGEQTIQQRLYTSELPDPDLVIRTSGEMRVSNFLLWQISYSELWVTTKAWPEFSEDDFAEALADFSQRQRRFGAISPPGPP
jgi:undecaprenyl diphosphate synthase